jgi:hypothetical protein
MREIVPPLESITADTYALVDFAMKNRAIIALTEHADRTTNSASG